MRPLFFASLLTSTLVACGNSPAPAAPTPSAPSESAPPVASAEPTPSAEPAKPAQPPAPTPPTAELSGKAIRLSWGGKTYDLSNGFVVKGSKALELHFEQPMSDGYNQLWIVPREVKKGKPGKVEGSGMSAVFLQLAEGKEQVRNVSNDCGAQGTVTFDAVPAKKGDKASGSVDLVITCTKVKGIDGPIAVKGSFADMPLQ
jgi:hypothetical protein